MTSAKRGEGVSQKLTKVDKGGRGDFVKSWCQPPIKFIWPKLWHLPPFGPFYFQKLYFFSNFLLSYWTYLLKNMFIWKKLRFSFVAHNIRLHQPVLKSWCQPGGEGGYFLSKADRSWQGGGRGQNWPNFGWRHLWTIPYSADCTLSH